MPVLYSKNLRIRILNFSCIAIATSALMIFLSYVYYNHYTHSPNYDATIYIKTGSSAKQITYLLKQNHLISSSKMFLLSSYINHLLGNYLKAGEYEVKAKSSPSEILKLLISGEVVQHQVTIPEGLSNYQILEILKNSYGVTSHEESTSIPEGFLMPDTYYYVYPTTQQDLLKKMNQSMLNFLANQRISPSSPFNNLEDIIKLASIVEKETSIKSEYPLVSSVYINRLNKQMPLQADPTLIYGLTNGKYNSQRLLTRKDLAIKNTYNTYLNKGLPPTAICNPGKNAILSVLNPVKNDLLYFVANGEGGHNFASNYKAHLKNVKNYRITIQKQ